MKLFEPELEPPQNQLWLWIAGAAFGALLILNLHWDNQNAIPSDIELTKRHSANKSKPDPELSNFFQKLNQDQKKVLNSTKQVEPADGSEVNWQRDECKPEDLAAKIREHLQSLGLDNDPIIINVIVTIIEQSLHDTACINEAVKTITPEAMQANLLDRLITRVETFVSPPGWKVIISPKWLERKINIKARPLSGGREQDFGDIDLWNIALTILVTYDLILNEASTSNESSPSNLSVCAAISQLIQQNKELSKTEESLAEKCTQNVGIENRSELKPGITREETLSQKHKIKSENGLAKINKPTIELPLASSNNDTMDIIRCIDGVLTGPTSQKVTLDGKPYVGPPEVSPAIKYLPAASLGYKLYSFSNVGTKKNSSMS